MARTALPVTEVVPTGVAPAATPGTVDGHYFDNRGEEILVIKNTGAGVHVVTVQTPRTVEGLTVAEQTNSIAAGATEYMGPFDQRTFNQGGANRGRVFVDYDATQSEVSVTVLKVPKAD